MRNRGGDICGSRPPDSTDGTPAIEALNLVSQIKCSGRLRAKGVGQVRTHVLRVTVGTMEGEYHVKLRDNATSFAQTIPRRIALPLMPKVKAELE